MPNAANRFAAARPIPLAPPVITAARPSANAACRVMQLLLTPGSRLESIWMWRGYAICD
jgi:hypothetical protein